MDIRQNVSLSAVITILNPENNTLVPVMELTANLDKGSYNCNMSSRILNQELYLANKDKVLADYAAFEAHFKEQACMLDLVPTASVL
jgi:hypothetical protein